MQDEATEADQNPGEHWTLSAPPAQEKPASHETQKLTSIEPAATVCFVGKHDVHDVAPAPLKDPTGHMVEEVVVQ